MKNDNTTENQEDEFRTDMVVKDDEPEVTIKIMALGQFGKTAAAFIFSEDHSCSQIEILQIDRNDRLNDVTNFLAGTDLLFILYDLDEWKKDHSLIVSFSKLLPELGILSISLLPHSNTIIQELGGKLQPLLLYIDTIIPLTNTKYSLNTTIELIISNINHICNNVGLVGVDFAELRWITTKHGLATLGIGASSEPKNAAKQAALSAIEAIEAYENKLQDAQGCLIIIESSLKSFELQDLYDIVNLIKDSLKKEANLVTSYVSDESMLFEYRVTIIATGIVTSL